MKKNTNVKRTYLPTLADLIDSLTISQLKEVKFHDDTLAYAHELKRICHDIDMLIREKNVRFTSTLIRIITIIAQVNMSIWDNKDKMQEVKGKHYVKLLTNAHQLNGVRNTMKNKISEMVGDTDPSKKRTNVETDDVKGWRIHVD